MRWFLLPAWLAVLAAAFAAGVAIGRRDGRARPTAALAGCLLLIGLRIAWRLWPETEYDLLPFDAYVEVRPWWAFPFGVVATGIGAVRMSTRAARLGVGAAAALLAVAALEYVGLTLALDRSQIRGLPGPDGVCAQTTDYTCGAAAAATVLARLGVPATEREMADLCGTNAFTGTDEFGVARGLRRKLPPARRVDVVDADWEELVAAPKPAAATIRWSPTVDHWVVVLAADGEKVELGDPVRGVETWPRARFDERRRGPLVVVR